MPECNYFSYHPGDGMRLHETAQKAKADAENMLESERDVAADGWSEDVDQICWGRLYGSVEMTECRPVEPDDGLGPGIEKYADYELLGIDSMEGLVKLGRADLSLSIQAALCRACEEHGHEVIAWAGVCFCKAAKTLVRQIAGG